MGSESGFALFDDSHGQPHWSQTGFPSRELGTNFSGIAAAFIERGVDCRPCFGERLVDCLRGARVLVMPPPTGTYDPNEERWMAARQSLLTPAEVAAVVQFLDDGGGLLAFGYRFGDSFTASNLNLLFGALGCRINAHRRGRHPRSRTLCPVWRTQPIKLSPTLRSGSGNIPTRARTNCSSRASPGAEVSPPTTGAYGRLTSTGCSWMNGARTCA